VARPAATAITFELDPGQLDLEKWRDASSPGTGLLVLAGAVVEYARVYDRITAELLGRGDVIQPRDEEQRDAFVSCELIWRALEPVRFAILDVAFADRVRTFPQIGDELLRRVERRARDLEVVRAIAAQPRLDVRLVLLLWHLAPRWGRVEPGGIRLPLPLTHELLGRMVGAERPSVTHALGRLAAAGLVSEDSGGRHLHGTLEEHLGTLTGRSPDQGEKAHVSTGGQSAQ